jgi:capsular polysaccharide biosynthesis protein
MAEILQGGDGTLSHRTGEPKIVTLPPLNVGGAMLQYMPAFNEPPDIPWTASFYESMTPWVAEFHQVTVHTSAGLIQVGTDIVAETLMHTMPDTHGYQKSGNIIEFRHQSLQKSFNLTGSWLSLLGPMADNYYHWTVDIWGRLAAANRETLESCDGVLIPPVQHQFQRDRLMQSGLEKTHEIREFAATDSARIDRLFVPWSIAGQHRPHPALADLSERYNDKTFDLKAPSFLGHWPKRIYIDRRNSSHRPLLNEGEVIAALAEYGFVPVRLETLRLDEQQRLFANADIIVAPHGAGLTNILYARPDCKVIELIMDGWACWCFRHLSAIRRASYDCVVGKQVSQSDEIWVHARPWIISPFHVSAAVSQSLSTI